jgi:hypothetical protein
MDEERFDTWTRRRVSWGVGGLAATVLGWGTERALAGKKKKDKKPRKCADCCEKDGTGCTKASKQCTPKNCLSAPFTIEARWNNSDTDQDTYLFVPSISGGNQPGVFPFIDFDCIPNFSDCEDDVYPFICVSQDATGPGDEVTTVRRLIEGNYEYWIELDDPSPAGDLTVTLRAKNDRVVRSWISPANPSTTDQIGWHVFDLDGKTGSVRSINRVVQSELPEAHEPNDDVCPR